MIAVAVSRICGLPDVLAGSLDGCASLELKGAANSTEASAALLERALNAEHELTSITFADAPLGDEGASRLAALLPGRGGTLRTLRLDRCGVGAAGAALRGCDAFHWYDDESRHVHGASDRDVAATARA